MADDKFKETNPSSSTSDDLLPVLGLVEDVVPVATDSLATEEGGESTGWVDHLFWDHHFVLGFRFANHELANLFMC